MRILQAGEAAGTLAHSFSQIKEYYEKQWAWQRQLSGAAAYPAFLLLLMMIFIGVTVVFILPAFKKSIYVYASTFAIHYKKYYLVSEILLQLT